MTSRIRALASSIAVAGGVALGSLLAAPPQALADPVVVGSQTRSVHVAIPAVGEGGAAAIDETLTAPDNNAFTQTLDRTQDVGAGVTNSAFASQDSSFGNGSGANANTFTARATGNTSYVAGGTPGIVMSDSNFAITFSLAESRDYSVSGTGFAPDTSSGASNWSVILSGPGGTVQSFTKADFNPNNNDGAVITSPFSATGTLDAGDYTLSALSGVSGGTNATEIAAGFDLTFTATAAGGPPPPPTAIPLPPGVVPGLAMLAGLALVGQAKRRLRTA